MFWNLRMRKINVHSCQNRVLVEEFDDFNKYFSNLFHGKYVWFYRKAQLDCDSNFIITMHCLLSKY